MNKSCDAIYFSGITKAEMKEYVPENENLKMSNGLHKRGRCVNVWPQTYPDESMIIHSITQSKWARDSQIEPRQASCKAGRETVLSCNSRMALTNRCLNPWLSDMGSIDFVSVYPQNYETCCTEQSPSSDTVGDELWTYLTITKCNGYVGGIYSQKLLFAAWTLANMHCLFLQRIVWG